MQSSDQLFAEILHGRATPPTYAALVQRLYERPDEITDAMNNGYSLADMRRILDKYGRQPALGMMLLLGWLEHVDEIDSPALQRHLGQIVASACAEQAAVWRQRETVAVRELAEAA